MHNKKVQEDGTVRIFYGLNVIVKVHQIGLWFVENLEPECKEAFCDVDGYDSS